ncbi:hypothetical protein [Christensenella tenuis]|jgi:hypothetical protein|uniref:Phage-Barnase-EndoU-ColicinE5/D-RelE like nuclease 2 domain-containing protein n=1 Tax=Christensenella tenuis TaxID=2763033 RepID=A0ABR7EFC9_9FIRM|nr:hypothetical protein [Christensenella tenuis]MBC5648490.1 hypothetical protein [Christensenella tenuis]
MDKTVTVEIISGVEGYCVTINDYRIAGAKLWGGGQVVHSFKTTQSQIDRALCRTQPDNPPLTLDELRHLKESRDPVWLSRAKEWIFVATVADVPYAQVWYFTSRGMCKTVLYHHETFYRNKPKEEV